MPAIVGAFPNTIKNGDAEDATVVMSLFAFIQSQVNNNGCPATTGSAVLKGNGTGGTASAVAGTDFAPATTGSAVLKGNGAGGTAAAVAGTDFAAPGINSDITRLQAAAGVTAVTPAIGDSSTKLATTAFANPAASLAANGYVKLPSGLILQWGTSTSSNAGDVAVTLPVAFPTAIQAIGGTGVNSAGSPATTISVGTFSLTSAQFGGWQFPGGTATRVVTAFYWWAIGY